jgi:hypothetical protein
MPAPPPDVLGLATGRFAAVGAPCGALIAAAVRLTRLSGLRVLMPPGIYAPGVAIDVVDRPLPDVVGP